ncbi:cytochrome c [Rhodoferax sp.]|uniref:c-type cytochrome n=1 Tax=Rhodoferax sp. TaxID=50421 RepID=UPI00260B8788|nr:cytochrome c [Rhodoferax sp.]MDD2917785.1 cytochrome c [Rhodoferax sp.]
MNVFLKLSSALVVGTLLHASSASAASPGAVEHGSYLVNTILACGNCHTPKAADGRPIAGKELSGGGLSFNAPFFAGTASNITPDKETGIGNWSNDEIKRAITQGARPDHGRLANMPLAPVMWVAFYKAMTPGDLDAVVAYLRAVQPVRNVVPLPEYKRQIPRQPYPDAEKGFTEADMLNPVRRGAYLATIGHCMECHTPFKDGKTLYEQALGKGGKPYGPDLVKGYPADWPGSISRNITSHPEAGIGRWTDAEIKRAITQGVARDGQQLQPPMGFYWYSGLKEADLDAIVAWLRTVPPAE